MSIRVTILALLIVSSCYSSVAAQNLPDHELVVATKETVPFVIKEADGSWSGVSIELWRRIADSLNLNYRLVESDLEGMLAGLEDSSFDAVAAAITVTSERESTVDFSHPFYTTGLTIAVSSKGEGGWLTVLGQLFSLEFFTAVGALLIVLFLIGVVVWVFERRKNPEEFGGSAVEGIGSGLWWSAVTMTTVGYGDKAPKSFLGRVLGLIWMFAAIIVVSGFTAAITSSLTVSRLESGVRGPDDLPLVQVGSVPNSTSAAYLADHSITFVSYETPLQGLQALARGEIEAFVYDAPILRYLATARLPERVHVLPLTFFRQDYAIGLQQNSPLREPINKVLLEELQNADWEKLLERYFGK